MPVQKSLETYWMPHIDELGMTSNAEATILGFVFLWGLLNFISIFVGYLIQKPFL